MRLRRSSFGIVPIVAVLLVVMALPVGAKSDRPFYATMSGNEVTFDNEIVLDLEFVADRCPEMVEAGLPVDSLTTFVSPGIGTHLGQYVGTAQHCSNTTTGQYMDGRLTFVAANGDVLRGTYTNGSSDLSTFPEIGFSDEFTFVDGGSGHFTYASGGGSEYGTFNAFTGDFSVVMEGRISYSRK